MSRLELGPIWDGLDDDYRKYFITAASTTVTVVQVMEEGGLSREEALAEAIKLKRVAWESCGVILTDQAEEWHLAITRRLAEAMLDGTVPIPNAEENKASQRQSLVRLIAELVREQLPEEMPAVAVATIAPSFAELAQDCGFDIDTIAADALASLTND